MSTGQPATTPSKELLRQQMLLRSLWNDSSPAALAGWVTPHRGSAGPVRTALRGWQAYVANAHASSERALAASFPTVQQLMGDESFAIMARAYWHEVPPSRGDLAWLGEGLPEFIERSDQLASEPYLADTARLDWALNRCEAAADVVPDPATLVLLGECEPAELHLHLAAGTVLLASMHPIVSIWLAHHQPADANNPFEPVRAALASGQGEHALVWREGWRSKVMAVDQATAAFVSAVLSGASLGAALEAAGPDWNFEAWLLAAVPSGLVSHLTPTA